MSFPELAREGLVASCWSPSSLLLPVQVRDMVGRNPIILVGTKMDLLPEGCHPKEVAEWLLQVRLMRWPDVDWVLTGCWVRGLQAAAAFMGFAGAVDCVMR